MNGNETLGEAVRSFRKNEMCLTQSGFAERCGISKPTLVSVERGQRSPSLSTFRKLSEAMGVPTKYLMALKKEERK